MQFTFGGKQNAVFEITRNILNKSLYLQKNYNNTDSIKSLIHIPLPTPISDLVERELIRIFSSDTLIVYSKLWRHGSIKHFYPHIKDNVTVTFSNLMDLKPIFEFLQLTSRAYILEITLLSHEDNSDYDSFFKNVSLLVFDNVINIPPNTDLIIVDNIMRNPITEINGTARGINVTRCMITGEVTIPEGCTRWFNCSTNNITKIIGYSLNMSIDNNKISGHYHIPDKCTVRFNCSNNNITKITGCAKYMNISHNKLSGEVRVPIKCTESFDCSINRHITEVAGGAKRMDISKCNIRNTIHIPYTCNEQFNCSYNKIINIIGECKHIRAVGCNLRGILTIPNTCITFTVHDKLLDVEEIIGDYTKII